MEQVQGLSHRQGDPVPRLERRLAHVDSQRGRVCRKGSAPPMRKPLRTDEGAVDVPEERRRGTYPPDVLRRRRQLGLPVTPDEHAAHARGETTEPPVTRTQMEATLRRLLPRCSPLFA